MDHSDCENDIVCPNCHSSSIVEIPENEKAYGIGLYQIYDFIGGMNKVINQHKCNNCHYQF
jgi:hypothetical protein